MNLQRSDVEPNTIFVAISFHYTWRWHEAKETELQCDVRFHYQRISDEWRRNWSWRRRFQCRSSSSLSLRLRRHTRGRKSRFRNERRKMRQSVKGKGKLESTAACTLKVNLPKSERAQEREPCAIRGRICICALTLSSQRVYINFYFIYDSLSAQLYGAN